MGGLSEQHGMFQRLKLFILAVFIVVWPVLNGFGCLHFRFAFLYLIVLYNKILLPSLPSVFFLLPSLLFCFVLLGSGKNSSGDCAEQLTHHHRHRERLHPPRTHTVCPSPLRQEAEEHQEHNHHTLKQLLSGRCKTSELWHSPEGRLGAGSTQVNSTEL